MSHSHISAATAGVANELHNVDFQTKVVTGNQVQVSLSKRKPSTMEVWIALDQLFEGISFTVKSLSRRSTSEVSSVLVVVED